MKFYGTIVVPKHPAGFQLSRNPKSHSFMTNPKLEDLRAADLVITHALEWPSLTVQWLPVRSFRNCSHNSPFSRF